jgi:predicted alpha/beta hydrolase family esterase
MLARAYRLAQSVELCACLAMGAWLHAAHAWGFAAIVIAVVAWFAGVRFLLVCLTMIAGWILRSPRPPEQRIGVVGTIGLVAGEWSALVAFNLFYLPWEWLALRADREPTPTERVPVVLMHGYFANRGYFQPLVKRLESAGIGPIFVPNFRAWLAPIARFEEELHVEIERIVAGTGQPRVVLVAHSMGGLAARGYIARHGAARVARLVTIASPHHGTAIARFGVGANAREMEEGSRFLAALESIEADPRCRPPATSIYSPHDNMVAPQATSRLPWARNIALPGLGHMAIARSPRLFEVLLRELETAGVR